MTAVTPTAPPADRLVRLDPAVPTGRVVTVPAGRYDWLRLTTSATGPVTAVVRLYYTGGTDAETLDVPAGPRATVRVPVTRRDDLIGFRLASAGAFDVDELSLVRPARLDHDRVLLEVAS